jgi:hypothetical protein
MVLEVDRYAIPVHTNLPMGMLWLFEGWTCFWVQSYEKGRTTSIPSVGKHNPTRLFTDWNSSHILRRFTWTGQGLSVERIHHARQTSSPPPSFPSFIDIMPRIPTRTTPYDTPTRQHRHFKNKRDQVLRALGEPHYLSAVALIFFSFFRLWCLGMPLFGRRRNQLWGADYIFPSVLIPGRPIVLHQWFTIRDHVGFSSRRDRNLRFPRSARSAGVGAGSTCSFLTWDSTKSQGSCIKGPTWTQSFRNMLGAYQETTASRWGTSCGFTSRIWLSERVIGKGRGCFIS